MRRAWVLAVALTAAHVGGLQAQELTIEQVKDGLYVILGSGGNVGVRVTDEGVILVDDKFPQNFQDIQRLVRTVSDQPVRYVLNTHHHGDHSGGNIEYLGIAEVIAHQNARDNMVRANQEGQPRVVFSDQTAVYLGGVEVRAYHMGTGHTNGDAVIYFPDLRTVHGGDLLHGTAPFIDYANGGSSRGWVATVNNILELPFDTAIPGHGAVMDRGDVTAFRNQMEAVRSRMAELIAGGMPAGQAATRIRSAELSWTQAEQGLFMQRSIPGFYEEIAAELREP
ncbi:MAG TPA: MBL fold metallo-hydrolase [Longimicrobiales bacterium]|nr:MBL fold metallo-hydrolase [Longimicrobiales bacterium]